MVYNPQWLQIIGYLAVAGLPFLAGYIYFLSFDFALKSRFLASAIFVALALWLFGSRIFPILASPSQSIWGPRLSLVRKALEFPVEAAQLYMSGERSVVIKTTQTHRYSS